MRKAILCAALVAGCPRPAPPPTLPGATTSDWDATPAPPMAAEPAGTETIAISAAVLDRVGLAHVEAVVSWFAASPAWRVSELNGPIAAVARWDEGARVADRSGLAPDGTRSLVRFLSWNAGTPWSDAPTVTRVPCTATAAELALWETPDGVASAIAIDSTQLGIEVLQVGGGRQATAAAVSRAVEALEAALAGDPVEAVAARALSVTSPGPGRLEVVATVNPGRPGWTWLRLVDGEPWHEEVVAMGTREAVGWSDEGDAFLFESRFGVPGGPAFRATAELWFLAADAAEPVVLKAVRTKVPAR